MIKARLTTRTETTDPYTYAAYLGTERVYGGGVHEGREAVRAAALDKLNRPNVRCTCGREFSTYALKGRCDMCGNTTKFYALDATGRIIAGWQGIEAE